VVESSGDGAAAIVRERFPDVTLICSDERLTAGGARNRGAMAARGKVIFFVDQDCVVPETWIRDIMRHLDDPTLGGVGGSVGVRDTENWSGWGVYFLEFFHHFPTKVTPRRNKNFLLGCNAAYRVEAIRAVAFPDRTLGEDVLFSYEMRRNYIATVYDPTIEVKHKNREGWGEFFDYNRHMGRSSASYHLVLNRWWARPFLLVPTVVFISPLIILPSIAGRVGRSRWSYLGRFILLLPMCLLGNLVWAAAFRRQVIRARSDYAAVCDS
jgi:GT2 family glycosyltransferase